MRKQRKYVIRRKTRLNNRLLLMHTPAATSAAFLSSCLTPISCFRSFASSLSYSESPTSLSFCSLVGLSSPLLFSMYLLSCPLLTQVSRLQVILSLFSMLSRAPSYLIFAPQNIQKGLVG